MKKYIPYLIITLVLAAAAVWFVLHRTNTTTNYDENAFTVPSAHDITKVIMTDTGKKRIELSNKSGNWMVNNKYIARPELVQSLFEILTRETVLCPVQKAAHDNVVRQMLAHNVKVEVYLNGDDKPDKVFYVGGPTPDERDTYMVLENDGQVEARPCIVYLPGLRGYLTPRFNTDEETWRSRLLFDYQPGDIKSLSVEYPDKEENSFHIEKIAPDSFAVSPHNEKYSIRQTYRQKYVKEYLGFYSSVSIEAYYNDFIHKDSVIQTVPFCIITVGSNNDSVNRVKLFRMPISKRSKSQFDEYGKPMTYDIDHFYAAINNDKDFTIIQYYVFGKLLRNYRDFFYRPGAAQ